MGDYRGGVEGDQKVVSGVGITLLGILPSARKGF